MTKPNGDTRSTLLPGNSCMQSPPPLSNIRKRSFRRAIKRVQQSPTSSTMYRGRRMILRSASSPETSAPLKGEIKRLRLVSAKATRGARLRICTYNAGGLDTTAFDLLINWLQTCPYDVVVLQEIHHGMGKESNQSASKGLQFLTSVDPSTRFQGLAILLRATLAPEYDIRFQEIHHLAFCMFEWTFNRLRWTSLGCISTWYRRSAYSCGIA